MPRYIDAERMPRDHFFKGLSDIEKGKVISWMLQSPTVDVAPVRHGRWVHREDRRLYESPYFCSECLADGSYEPEREYYCYNCGAKMDGGNV